jgi:hypothetical protein
MMNKIERRCIIPSLTRADEAGKARSTRERALTNTANHWPPLARFKFASIRRIEFFYLRAPC